MNLVCFKVKHSNVLTAELHERIENAGLIYVTAAEMGDKYILRFAVGSRLTASSDSQGRQKQ